MAGTDLLTLSEAPGTGMVPDSFQFFGKLPGLPGKEFRVPASRVKGSGAADLPTNQRKGGPFYLKYLNQDEVTQAGGEDFGSALFSLPDGPDGVLCLGCRAFVELVNDNGKKSNVEYVLLYDERDPGALNQIAAYLDGDFAPIPSSPYPGGLTMGRWLPVGSPEAAAAIVPRYRTDLVFAVDDNTKILFPGDTADSFFTALKAGLLPSPVKGQTDANWRVAAAPVGTAPSFATLPGNARDNASLAAALGAPQWVAGKQAAGALVYDQGRVYRVKQAIANSQVISAQYYEFIGGPEVLASLAAIQAVVPTEASPSNQLVSQSGLQVRLDNLEDDIIAQFIRGQFRISFVAGLYYNPGDWLFNLGRYYYYNKAVANQLSSFQASDWTEIAFPAGFEGPWLANHRYRQYALVIAPDTGKIRYANQDFTTTGTYNAANWTDWPGGGTSTSTPYNDTDVKASIFGRFLGPWKAGLAAKKFDSILTPDGLALRYAAQDFTTGASYDASKWVDLIAVVTSAQVQDIVNNRLADFTLYPFGSDVGDPPQTYGATGKKGVQLTEGDQAYFFSAGGTVRFYPSTITVAGQAVCVRLSTAAAQPLALLYDSVGTSLGTVQPGEIVVFSLLPPAADAATYTAADGALLPQLVSRSMPASSGTGGSRDLLDLTTGFMDSVMALAYTNCDAAPSASPSGSYPGQRFDAIDPADNFNYHYYCARGTYVRGNTTTGAGPAWHRIKKS